MHSEQRASPGTNQYTRQRQTKTPTIQVNLAVPLDDDLVLDALAGSPNSPPQLLRQLSRRRTASPTLRIRLALNPACPPALLRQLAADPDYHVRNAVVRNPCCPPRLLTQAHHQDPGWDILIAGNPCCPPRLLTQLARSGEPTVQIAVARHPRCPPPTIQHLAGEMAVGTVYIDTPNGHLQEQISVSNIALTHPACPPAVLAQYSTNRNSSLRAAVAANPSCPPPILSQLAAEQQPLEVRCPAAANSSCPPDTLTELLNDLWPSVVQAAADNPNLPPHALAMWQLVQDTVQL